VNLNSGYMETFPGAVIYMRELNRCTIDSDQMEVEPLGLDIGGLECLCYKHACPSISSRHTRHSCMEFEFRFMKGYKKIFKRQAINISLPTGSIYHANTLTCNHLANLTIFESTLENKSAAQIIMPK
jgi:hypothetical protein